MTNDTKTGLVFAGIAVTVLLIGSFIYFFGMGVEVQPKDQTLQRALPPAPPAKTSGSLEQPIAEHGPENAEPETPASQKETKGAYLDYSTENFDRAVLARHKIVLFFHAPWCPFCRAADKAFTERLGEIPQNVTVLKTDYDTSSDMKTKYGVTYQHTFVQVDSNMNLITKWNGGDIDTLKQNIK